MRRGFAGTLTGAAAAPSQHLPRRELRLVPGSPGGKMEATTKMAAHVKLDPTQHPHLRSSHPFHREPASWVQHPQGFSTLDLGHHGGAPVTHSSQDPATWEWEQQDGRGCEW
ncbi:Hypothetical predicted protein [Marmota monax]|uniref:Uncharacterized protein n=1 Tax=Marmota monax TaxID=9995 RepID=A0A5E4AXR7_MARMO|nr:hypothetical protein GHT09_009271 [Marmota monax]VTJ62167.1 Hypothetical predicted protein [Marmota monax]